jgi:hypothetical protein
MIIQTSEELKRSGRAAVNGGSKPEMKRLGEGGERTMGVKSNSRSKEIEMESEAGAGR